MAQKMIDQKLDKTADKLPAPSRGSRSSSARERSPKRKSAKMLPPADGQKHRQCESAGCKTKIPICFARATEYCCGTAWTSRWYHLSPAEHFCNACFEHFYRGDGNDTFNLWKEQWNGKATSDLNVRTYMADQYLPYWLQCNIPTCHKWRQMTRDVKMSPEFISSFVCGMTWQGIKKDKQVQYCSVSEDERVIFTKTVPWLNHLCMTPRLKNSPTAPYVAAYFSEDVGLRPIDSSETDTIAPQNELLFDGFVQPFTDLDPSPHASMFHPANLNRAEAIEFSYYSKNPALSMYLGSRNLVLTLWAKNYHKRLTYEDCMQYLVCRGICRVHYIELVKYIIASFTQQGVINYGILPPSPLDDLIANKQVSVLVVGAGMAGLSAASRLSQSGISVKVCESSDRIGGRIKDSTAMGVSAAEGAQWLSGEINNPLSIAAQQIGCRMRPGDEVCCLMNYRGEFVSSNIDRRVEFHFNALLDIVGDWRKNKTPSSDCSLYDKLMEMHQQFLDETQLKFSEEEVQALNFQLAKLEHLTAAPLNAVSSIFWDQHEDSPQFPGSQNLIVDGYGKILSKLASGLDILFNNQVTAVEHSCGKVNVKTSQGHSLNADKVIITVPLSILKTSAITFKPPLPEKKLKAINKLAVGHIEKIIMKFSRNFWSLKIKNAVCFGRTTKNANDRGLFPIFYDLSNTKTKNYVLVSHVCGHALQVINKQTDEEVMLSCLSVLRSLFPVEDISPPVEYTVTRWSRNAHTGMAYSYLPVGVTGSVYDSIADDINDTVYFAGEATSSDFPQTVTGAYLSGIREANKILATVLDAYDT